MTRLRRRCSALLGGAAFLALSCADPAPLGVTPRDDLLGLPWLTGLVPCTPLPYDSVTQIIDSSGGTINVGPHSFFVPPGALTTAAAITAVAPSLDVNAVRFQPEGLTFAEPARLTLSFANCDVLGLPLPRQIAHTTDDLVTILVYLPSGLSGYRQVTGEIDHFSTYAVAW